MGHEPCSFEGHAQGPVQLVRAYALLAGADQEYSLQPFVHRDMAGLEDGTDLDGEWLAAGIAFVGAHAGALALQLADTLEAAAMWADRAIGPNTRLYEPVGGLFVMKMGVRETRHFSIPFAYPLYIGGGGGYVKYNIAFFGGAAPILPMR